MGIEHIKHKVEEFEQTSLFRDESLDYDTTSHLITDYEAIFYLDVQQIAFNRLENKISAAAQDRSLAREDETYQLFSSLKDQVAVFDIYLGRLSWHHQLACAANFLGDTKALLKYLQTQSASENLVVSTEIVVRLAQLEQAFFLVNALVLAVLAKLYLNSASDPSEAVQVINTVVIPLYTQARQNLVEFLENNQIFKQRHPNSQQLLLVATKGLPEQWSNLTEDEPAQLSNDREKLINSLSSVQKKLYFLVSESNKIDRPSLAFALNLFIEGSPAQKNSSTEKSFSDMF